MSAVLERKKTTTMAIMQDIVLDITWSKIAQTYFPNKSVAWFYNKLRGVDGNGGSGDFNYEERLRLRSALLDFSQRVRDVANELA